MALVEYLGAEEVIRHARNLNHADHSWEPILALNEFPDSPPLLAIYDKSRASKEESVVIRAHQAALITRHNINPRKFYLILFQEGRKDLDGFFEGIPITLGYKKSSSHFVSFPAREIYIGDAQVRNHLIAWLYHKKQ